MQNNFNNFNENGNLILFALMFDADLLTLH
jgi:hypothetical protein